MATEPGNDGRERTEVLAKVAAIMERYTCPPPVWRQVQELRPGEVVAMTHELLTVETVEVFPGMVFVRMAGWPYALNPTELVQVVPVEVEQ